jgi:AcrR family transcriptional regulator
MGVAERREREKHQRREEILDAAEKVFFSKSVKGATMDEIAEQAELSKGTLYLYFESKEDIYLGIHMRAVYGLRRRFEKAMEEEETGVRKLRAIGETYLEFSQEQPDYYRALMHFKVGQPEHAEKEIHDRHCGRCGEELLGIVARAVEAGIADGSLRPDLDPRKTSLLLWAQTEGVISILTVRGDHLGEFGGDRDELFEEFLNLLGYALLPYGETGPERDRIYQEEIR